MAMDDEMKKWLIISWKRNDYMDGCYGKILDEYEGTYEGAANFARIYIENFSPISVVGVIA